MKRKDRRYTTLTHKARISKQRYHKDRQEKQHTKGCDETHTQRAHARTQA